jgi:hypothetical protein
MSESILEGVSEPQHLVSEVVERACEATMISNDLTSTPTVFSTLVLVPLQDEAPIHDESIPPMDKQMAMMDDDAPPTWYHQVDEDIDQASIFATSPTTHERSS